MQLERGRFCLGARRLGVGGTGLWCGGCSRDSFPAVPQSREEAVGLPQPGCCTVSGGGEPACDFLALLVVFFTIFYLPGLLPPLVKVLGGGRARKESK